MHTADFYQAQAALVLQEHWNVFRLKAFALTSLRHCLRQGQRPKAIMAFKFPVHKPS